MDLQGRRSPPQIGYPLHLVYNWIRIYYILGGGFCFMKLTCHQCGIEFEKEDKEIRRAKRGTGLFSFVAVVVRGFMRIK